MKNSFSGLTIASFLIAAAALFISFDKNKAIVGLEQQNDSLELVVDSLYKNAVVTNGVVRALAADSENLKYWLLPVTSDYIRQTEFKTPDYFLKGVEDTLIYNTFQGKIYPSLGEWQKVIKYLEDKAKEAAKSDE